MPCPDQPAPSLHPFHVSTTEITHNTTERVLEISVRIFTDDFESSLRQSYQQPADFAKPAVKTLMDTLVKRYVLSHLGLRADGKSAPMHYLGWELDNEAVYVYLEVENVPVPHLIESVNTIMFNLFDDQMNLQHVKVNGKRQSMKLSYPEKTAAFRF